jgi:SAM-dependent methyltransferase
VIFERADWYDAFNRDKDYAAEADGLLERVGRFAPAPRRWLDLGCGTGHHLARLRERGIEVEGLDASPPMIARAAAAHPQIPFHVGKAQELDLEGGRDVISLLFHVLSYLVVEDDAQAALRAAGARLRPGGVLVFDFWHAGGLRADPPGRRVRSAPVDGRILYRVAEPRPADSGVIQVRFDYRWDAEDGPLAHHETHALRAWTADGIRSHLRAAGLEEVACEGWTTRRPLAEEDWYGLVIARPARG